MERKKGNKERKLWALNYVCGYDSVSVDEIFICILQFNVLFTQINVLKTRKESFSFSFSYFVNLMTEKWPDDQRKQKKQVFPKFVYSLTILRFVQRDL